MLGVAFSYASTILGLIPVQKKTNPDAISVCQLTRNSHMPKLLQRLHYGMCDVSYIYGMCDISAYTAYNERRFEAYKAF